MSDYPLGLGLQNRKKNKSHDNFWASEIIRTNSDAKLKLC